MIVQLEAPVSEAFAQYRASDSRRPLFFCGDALKVLAQLPHESIDCVMTSPPYWGQRQYEASGIGLENEPSEYVRELSRVFREVKRVLKPEGSFWLNIG